MKYNSNPLGDMTKTVTPEMCECGRLYKDRRDANGKMMCSACYSDCDVETLRKLWGIPVIRREEAEKIWPTEEQIRKERIEFYTDRPNPWEK